MDTSMLESFRLDWILAGKAPRTAEAYVRSLTHMMNSGVGCDPVRVRQWMLEAQELSVLRLWSWENLVNDASSTRHNLEECITFTHIPFCFRPCTFWSFFLLRIFRIQVIWVTATRAMIGSILTTNRTCRITHHQRVPDGQMSRLLGQLHFELFGVPAVVVF